MSGNGFFVKATASVVGFFSRLLESWFGPGVHHTVFGPVTWVELGVAALPILFVVVINAVLAFVFRRQVKKMADPRHWRRHLFGGLGGPIYAILWIAGIYLALSPFLLKFFHGNDLEVAHHVSSIFFGVLIFVALLWLLIRLARVAEARMDMWAAKIPGRTAKFFVPLAGRSLRVILPLLAIIFFLPVFGLPNQYRFDVDRASSILIIGAIAWILFQAVEIGQQALLAQYDLKAADNLQARKVYTQSRVIGRTLHVTIAICSIATILMTFQEVRQVGASMLASAGIVGIVAGVAAQKTLGNLIAGFQIALAQPMRLDDVVVVDNQWGRIEEITLTYVVVHVWNDIRLVVPFSYFIEQPFQNWTKSTSQLLEQVTVWMDYSLPLEHAREALKEIIETNKLWDKRFWNMQVVDSSDKAMQLRVLATSADASIGWNLCCDIREKFIVFVQKNYPQCLPRLRAEIERRAVEKIETELKKAA